MAGCRKKYRLMALLVIEILCINLILSSVGAMKVEAVAEAKNDFSGEYFRTPEPTLCVNELWLDAHGNYWNRGHGAQTCVTGIDKEHGNYFELHKVSDTVSEFIVSTDNAPVMDIRDMQFLEFDLYLPAEYVTYLSEGCLDGSLELSSAGKCDNSEISTTLSQICANGISAGWNHIKLDLNDFLYNNGETGRFDPTNLNYFRFYVVREDATQLWWFRMTGLRFTAYTRKDLNSTGYTPCGEGDGGSGWNFLSGDVNGVTSANMISSVATDENGQNQLTTFLRCNEDAVSRDMSGMQYLEFDLYLSDKSVIFSAGDMQIEVRSNKTDVDDYEIHWGLSNIKDMNLVNGWNHVKLDLSTATPDGTNSFDISQVSYFRIYIVGSDGTPVRGELKMANICFTRPETKKEVLILNDCSNKDSVGGADAVAFHDNHADCVYGNNGYFSLNLTEPVDIREYEYLEFELWISDSWARDTDTDIFKEDVAIELSSGGMDVDELQLSWQDVAAMGLVTGWNQIKIGLDSFSTESGNIDLSAVNWFRIYFVNANQKVPLMIDDIRVTKEVQEIEEVLGDMNFDGEVDVRDLIRVKSGLGGTSTVDVQYSSDINDDGKISTMDFSMLKNKLVDIENKKLYFIDLDYMTGEFQHDTLREYDILNLIFSLQGILNREEPTMFIEYLGETDEFWYKYLKGSDKMLTDYTRMNIRSFDDFIAEFSDIIKQNGVILWDTDVPSTVNVAETVCSVTGALPLRAGSKFTEEVMTTTGAKANYNLDNKFTGSGTIWGTSRTSTGSTKNDAYIWALETFGAQVNWSVLGYYVDAYGQDKASYDVSETLCISNRDYIIANKGFFFDLSPWSDEQPNDDRTQTVGTDCSTLKEILAYAYSENGGAFGTVCGYSPWTYKYSEYSDSESSHTDIETEHRLVETLTSYNMVLDADSAPYGSLANGSVYQHYTLSRTSYENSSPSESITYDSDKYYVTIYMGDYDSSAWTTKFVPQMYNDDARGEFDINWSFNLQITNRCPMIFDYVYENKTEHDYFTAGNSGVGYTAPNVIVNRTDSNYASGAEQYVTYCRPLLEKFDIDYLGIAIATDKLTPDIFKMYSDMGIRGFAHNVPSMATNSSDYITTHEGVSAIWMRELPERKNVEEGNQDYIIECGDNILQRLDSIKSKYGSNVSSFRTILWTPTEIKQLREYLLEKNPNIVFCNADTFVDVMSKKYN